MSLKNFTEKTNLLIVVAKLIPLMGCIGISAYIFVHAHPYITYSSIFFLFRYKSDYKVYQLMCRVKRTHHTTKTLFDTSILDRCIYISAFESPISI